MKFSEMSDIQFVEFLEMFLDNSVNPPRTTTHIHVLGTYKYLKTGKLPPYSMKFFSEDGLKKIFYGNYFMINLLLECEKRYNQQNDTVIPNEI